MPTKTIEVSVPTLISGTTRTVIGTAMDAVLCPNNVAHGGICEPTRIPDDLDVTRPVTLDLMIAASASLSEISKAIRLRYRWTLGRAGVAVTGANIDFTVGVPDNWVFDTPIVVPVDNGNAVTFDGHHFQRFDWFGGVFFRLGTDPLDTYTGAVKIAANLDLEYFQRCQFSPC